MKQTLTESQLKNFIYEAVKRTLNEIGDTPAGQEALGRLSRRNVENARAAQKNGNKDEYFKNMDKFNDVENYAKDARSDKKGTEWQDNVTANNRGYNRYGEVDEAGEIPMLDTKKKAKALYTELIRFAIMNFPQAVDDKHKMQLQTFVERKIEKHPDMDVEQMAQEMENPNNPNCLHALFDYANWAQKYPEAAEAKRAMKRVKR